MLAQLKKILNVKTKLMLLLLLVTIVPMIVISVLVSNYMQSTLHDDFVESANNELMQLDKTIVTFFDVIDQNTLSLASNPDVKKADSTITAYYNNPGNSDGKIKNTPLVHGTTEADIYKLYANFGQTHKEAAYIYMGTQDGGYIQWPNTDLPANYDPRVRPWYQTGMAHKGEVSRGQPYIWAVDNAVLISTMTTIENYQGQVVGVQGIDVSLKNLADKISIGNSGYIIMTTEDGTILFDPKHPDLNLKNINELHVKELNNLADISHADFEINLDNKTYVANVYTSQKSGWKYIALVNKDQLLAKVHKIQVFLLTLAVIFAIIVLIVAYLFAHQFTKPIIGAAKFAGQIASGNLAGEEIKTKANDELGVLAHAVNSMRSNLAAMIEQIRTVAAELVATSEELTATSQEASSTMGEIIASMDGTAAELDKDVAQQQEGVKRALAVMDELSGFIQQIAQGAEDQATKVIAMAETTSQMASALQEVAANAQAVSQASKATSNEAVQGEKAVMDSIKGMHEIKETVFGAAQKISQLGNHSQQIGEIVAVIDDIAEQTNLLALNAAIEAARAGEHGKGFAVVADEVRKLAERSSKSTSEIRDLIISVQALTEESVQAMDKGTKEVESGVQLSEDAGKALKQIISNVTETDGQINSISAVIEELSASSTEIVQSVDQVSSIAEANATASGSMHEKAKSVTQAIMDISQRASNSSAYVREATEATGRVANISENISSATEGLETIAQELQKQISQFRVK